MRWSNSYQQLKGMPKSIPNPDLSVLRPRSPTQETLRKCKLHFQNWTHFFACFTSPSKNPRSHSSGISGDFLHGSNPGVPNIRSQANTLVDYIILQCQKPLDPHQGLALPSLHLSIWPPINPSDQLYRSTWTSPPRYRLNVHVPKFLIRNKSGGIRKQGLWST